MSEQELRSRLVFLDMSGAERHISTHGSRHAADEFLGRSLPAVLNGGREVLATLSIVRRAVHLSRREPHHIRSVRTSADLMIGQKNG